MNDSSEIIYAYDLVKELIEQYLKNTDSKLWSKCLNRFMEEIEAYKMTFEAYAFCMCEDDNLLSQWREYSNRGIGYAIGFIRKSLEIIAKDNVQYELLQVIYDKNKQWKIFEKVIIKVKQFLEETNGSDDGITIACELLRDGIALYIPQFKHEGFKAENEWRLVYRPGSFLQKTYEV